MPRRFRSFGISGYEAGLDMGEDPPGFGGPTIVHEQKIAKVLVVVIFGWEMRVESAEHVLGRKQKLPEVDAVGYLDQLVNEIADGRKIPQVVPTIIELENLSLRPSVNGLSPPRDK